MVCVHAGETMEIEEYLTVKEAAERIRFKRQTMYNLIHQRQFVLGKHYYKPTPKKILFIWSALQQWIEGGVQIEGKGFSEQPKEFVAVPKTRINI
jgi:excisionase family DNA binding protein